jgi:hypothetical protein
MIVREIEMTQRTPQRAATIHIEIDEVGYFIIGSRHSVTVLYDKWMNRRWARGKTFFSASELAKHYKKHGQEVAKYANRVTSWGM